MKWEVAVAEPDALGASLFWHPHEQRRYWIDIDIDIDGRRVRRRAPSVWRCGRKLGPAAAARVHRTGRIRRAHSGCVLAARVYVASRPAHCFID